MDCWLSKSLVNIFDIKNRSRVKDISIVNKTAYLDTEAKREWHGDDNEKNGDGRNQECSESCSFTFI